MDWFNSETDLRLICGSAADKLLEWTGCDTDGKTVHRVVLGDRCVWAQLIGGKWHLIAFAPVGDVFDRDAVDLETFFAKRFPKEWETRAKAISLDPERNQPCAVGEFVCGRRPSGEFLLAKCTAEISGTPTHVTFADDQPERSIDTTGAKKWFKMRGRQHGCAALYFRGKSNFHNYRLLCMQAANAEHKWEKGALSRGEILPDEVSPKGFAGKALGEAAKLEAEIDVLRRRLSTLSQPHSDIQAATDTFAVKNGTAEPSNTPAAPAEEEIPFNKQPERCKIKAEAYRKFLADDRWSASPVRMLGCEAFIPVYDAMLDMGLGVVDAFAAADTVREAAEAEFCKTDYGAQCKATIDSGSTTRFSKEWAFKQLGRTL